MAVTASYAGLKNSELWKLHRQWLRNRKGITCEAGHEKCGCSRDRTQDGIAPCHREVEHEIIWRGLAGDE